MLNELKKSGLTQAALFVSFNFSHKVPSKLIKNLSSNFLKIGLQKHFQKNHCLTIFNDLGNNLKFHFELLQRF